MLTRLNKTWYSMKNHYFLLDLQNMKSCRYIEQKQLDQIENRTGRNHEGLYRNPIPTYLWSDNQKMTSMFQIWIPSFDRFIWSERSKEGYGVWSLQAWRVRVNDICVSCPPSRLARRWFHRPQLERQNKLWSNHLRLFK